MLNIDNITGKCSYCKNDVQEHVVGSLYFQQNKRTLLKRFSQIGIDKFDLFYCASIAKYHCKCIPCNITFRFDANLDRICAVRYYHKSKRPFSISYYEDVAVIRHSSKKKEFSIAIEDGDLFTDEEVIDLFEANILLQ